MPWTPKSAAPQRTQTPPLLTLEHAADGGITLFAAPPGYLPTNNLAAALHARRRPTLWLRLGSEDRDPAVLLVSLIAGMQRFRAGAGTATLDQMRRHPGPIAGWPVLFGQLAQELAELLGSGGALVLENCHYLSDACQTLRLLGTHVLSTLPPGISCVLTADQSLPLSALPARTAYQDAGALRINGKAAQALADQYHCNLSSACIRDAVALANGRAVAIMDLCAAAGVLGPAPIQQAVARAAKLDDLLAWIAHAWLVTLQPGGQQALALVLRLAYMHPALMQTALGATALPSGPWFEQLDDDWSYVQPIWRNPLRAALRSRAKPERLALQRAADDLVTQGAIEQAVPLYFELGAWTSAAQVIATAADKLMSIGQWETLDDWLSQLPSRTLEERPWLVYVGGELAAAQGQVTTAQHAFALASKIFTTRHDAQGACQSLLAESTLASWNGDHSRAEARALTANTLAENSGMPWYQSWAAWQLGCLAAAADDLDAALLYFTNAEESALATGDALILELPRQAERLTLYQRGLRRKREFHRQAYYTIEQSEQEAAERLDALLSGPPVGVDALLEAHGWVRLPLMLKLPAPCSTTDVNAITVQTSMLNHVLNKLGLRRHSNGAATAHSLINSAVSPSPRLRMVDQVVDLVGDDMRSLSLLTTPAIAESVANPSLAVDRINVVPKPNAEQLENGFALELGGWTSHPSPTTSSAAVDVAAPTLTAYLLGPFRVTLNDHAIESWPSARGRSIFKYLLTQRDRAVQRDVLMDLFWPDAAPDSARNSLNVALHGLRQAVRVVDELPIVIFANGTYRLNPNLSIWVDVEEFERGFQTARRLEATGQITAAVAEYEVAISLYQDDFIVDDPYEEWPVLTRERLRVMFLEALDRLSQIYFGCVQYAACISLCQRILARDNCREDAHCRLMRCHSRQGQQNLALRQYQICSEALRTELDVEPSPATTDLYGRIRSREAV
jgi:DNA-binding SARP family transcriptional activator